MAQTTLVIAPAKEGYTTLPRNPSIRLNWGSDLALHSPVPLRITVKVL